MEPSINIDEEYKEYKRLMQRIENATIESPDSSDMNNLLTEVGKTIFEEVLPKFEAKESSIIQENIGLRANLQSVTNERDKLQNECQQAKASEEKLVREQEELRAERDSFCDQAQEFQAQLQALTARMSTLEAELTSQMLPESSRRDSLPHMNALSLMIDVDAERPGSVTPTRRTSAELQLSPDRRASKRLSQGTGSTSNIAGLASLSSITRTASIGNMPLEPEATRAGEEKVEYNTDESWARFIVPEKYRNDVQPLKDIFEEHMKNKELVSQRRYISRALNAGKANCFIGQIANRKYKLGVETTVGGRCPHCDSRDTSSKSRAPAEDKICIWLETVTTPEPEFPGCDIRMHLREQAH
ncbi:hypothetical protein UCRPC4_g06668 [Phaeomoniella chlamydospora]|uniref:Uncharacterized protein n=1 Tax=Phaeomoniella chlamydospora TaxID=158046 RepID=A0A0G2DWT7_PHACM|nr:hypothetical protein UCRPC4_g06668 [Phaeomoniella chlamydospora]